jgi:hypothetical protein
MSAALRFIPRIRPGAESGQKRRKWIGIPDLTPPKGRLSYADRTYALIGTTSAASTGEPPQIEVATEGKAPKEVINIMAALKESMQARGLTKVRDAVRRRLGKPSKEKEPSPRASRPRPSPRRTAH